MPLIKPFRERYPEVTLSLVSSETIINLIERKVDVAIRAGTLTDSSLRARPLFNSYRKIIASPDYISRYGKPETIDDLKQHICLGFTEPASLNTWPIACSDGQLHEVKYGLSSNSGETLKTALPEWQRDCVFVRLHDRQRNRSRRIGGVNGRSSVASGNAIQCRLLQRPCGKYAHPGFYRFP
ncbi:LysR family transcriptional regulator [Escherichia coli]|uniref:LysR family transcriptional regulator n=1 Tax=Escherichia coli TaxID=562 RepID=A0A376TLF7_ECOLX|nr:LysR family transcriptional regulator [Escherichia coli]